ncbi:MAG TPA: alpha/beta hydrolase [Turneriella sp.]|nr:alpha/beta hydrolase [Turneriella sp.]
MPYFPNATSDLYYRTAGKGKTALILIHGWYQNGQQAYSAILPHLREKYHVFIPDLPGHGLTPHIPADFSTTMNENLLLEFARYIRQHYRCQKVFIAGHSYGAFSVLAMVSRMTAELDGVIALSAVDDYAPYHKRLKSVLRIPRLLTPIYYRLQALLGGFPYGDREQLYGDAHQELKPGKLAYAKKKNKTLPPAASRRYMLAFLSARVHWPAGQIQTPLLLVYGSRDMLTPASWAKKIQPHFKRSSVEVVADAGHNVQISAPKAVAGHVIKFIQLNTGKPRRR